MKKCATSDESAAWAKASGAATAKVTQHPLWVVINGKSVTDDSAGTDAWGTSVLKAICAAASSQNLKLPPACNGDDLVTPL